MIHLYDTRWATYEPDGSTRDVTPEEKRDPEFVVMPRYWVHKFEVEKKLGGRWDKSWLLGWRDIARSTDERTFIAAQLPLLGYGHKLLLALPTLGREDVQAAWSSFVFDFVARQKLGGTSMGYFVTNQLPMPSPATLTPHRGWIADRVDRLNARPTRGVDRDALRAEIDALMFHLYGVDRDDVDHILETFPIVKRKDLAIHGEYRTKRLILDAYDRSVAT
jgi:hypothetical protein